MKKSSLSLILIIFISIIFVSRGIIGIKNQEQSKVDISTTSGTVGNADAFINEHKESTLFDKAMVALDKLGDDQRIYDFKKTCLLLRTLPEDEEAFISNLEIANKIFEKYNVDFKYGGYYLLPKGTIKITVDGINKYRTNGVFSDINNLLEATIYPVLFEKYGHDIECIQGININELKNTLKNIGYSLDKISAKYDIYTEKWKYYNNAMNSYEMAYYQNGLVKSIELPLTIHKDIYSTTDYQSYYENSLEAQKTISNQRFINMVNQLDSNIIGYNILSKIFTDKEINIILNYIKSLSSEIIWERDLLSMYNSPSSYACAIVGFSYRGNFISISYGLNTLTLRIHGKNTVNDFSHQWYTIYCGTCLSQNDDEITKEYSSFLNNDVSSNDNISDFYFDLDSNQDKFISLQIVENSKSPETFKTSITKIPLYSSITANGIIERNSTSFPSYILRLEQQTAISFTEDDPSRVFYCDYLCFFDEPELNGNYNFDEMIGKRCSVEGTIYNYRNGDQLFIENPIIILK